MTVCASPFLSLILATLAASLAAAAPAAAAAACTAAPPHEGAVFSGAVLQVIDGERLCLAEGPTPDQWVEVRLMGIVAAADATPAKRRALLMTAAFSQRLDCVAGPIVDGAVQAVCTLRGEPLASQVAIAGQAPPWQLWR